MACDNCCLWPCNRTDNVCVGSHYEMRKGRMMQIIEVPPELGKVLEKAIISTLESEASEPADYGEKTQ